MTLPSDPFEEYAGTYPVTSEGGFGYNDYSLSSCNQMWAVHENVTIIIEINYHPWVGSYFEVLTYTPKASVAYGWAWTKGRPHVVDGANCSGHCNGTFVGAYATSSFVRNPQGEGILFNDQNHFINNEPGDFEVPYPRSWSLWGERTNEFNYWIYGVEPYECYYECIHDRFYFEDPEDKPPVSVSWHLKRGINSIPRELLPK